MFGALRKPVSGNGTHSRALQINQRLILMAGRPFSDNCENVRSLLGSTGIFRWRGVT